MRRRLIAVPFVIFDVVMDMLTGHPSWARQTLSDWWHNRPLDDT